MAESLTLENSTTAGTIATSDESYGDQSIVPTYQLEVQVTFTK